MIVNIIIGVALGLFFLIGFIIGLVKGFSKVQTWANEYVIAGLITVGVGRILLNASLPSQFAGIIIIATAIISLLVCIGVSKLIQKIISHSLKKREEEVRPYGAVGVINRLFGGFTLAIKGFVIVAIVAVSALVALDLMQMEAITSAIGEVYESAGWIAIAPIVFDMLVIGILHLVIRHGFSNGIATSLWSLFVFALVVGAAFMAYNLVFSVSAFEAPAQALAEPISGMLSGIPMVGDAMGEGMAVNIAKYILTAGIFLVLAIVIVVLSFLVKRVLNFARFGAAFYIVDGVFGALALLVIALAVMLLIGNIFGSIYDLEFMQPFTNYFANSSVATYFYDKNILLEMGVELIPLRSWLS